MTAGLTTARAPWVVVMDGDLQHPPATVPELLAAGQVDQSDAVVASRYRTRGRVDGLSGFFRRAVSRASGTLAKIFFPVRLRSVTDPMSGFLAVRRDALDTTALRPNGYKILLEVVVRGRLAKVTEVPYTFQPRQAGESKASWREGVRAGKLIVGQWFATFSSQYGNSARVSANASGISSVTGDDLATRTGYGLQQMFGLSPMFAVLLAAALILAWRRRGP